MPAGEIANRFAITRPAISRHLRVLRESGLVRDETVGRQRVYALDLAAFDELTAWLSSLAGPTWEQHLDALETEVYRTRRERRKEHEAHPDRKTGSDG
ncbi:ArsR/SmtB family transcription factor [Kibdelosporangium aridum]|uniref:ArsR/SmtB family transcription factor n=1 Tax=Kibdelosporangium aridum TaxID=2030 RepID=UPI0035E8EC7C